MNYIEKVWRSVRKHPNTIPEKTELKMYKFYKFHSQKNCVIQRSKRNMRLLEMIISVFTLLRQMKTHKQKKNNKRIYWIL